MPWGQSNKNTQVNKLKKPMGLKLIVILGSVSFVVVAIWMCIPKPINGRVTMKQNHPIKTVIKNMGTQHDVKEITDVKQASKVVSSIQKTLHQRLAKRKFGVGNAVHTSEVNIVRSKFEIFKHRSENYLALLMNAPLGTSLIGSKKYTQRFIDDIEKALDEKIEIYEDDPIELKDLKASIESVKKEIEHMKVRGEDIHKLLTETFNEIQKMGILKKSLESEIRKMKRDPNLSDEDMDILVQTANKMLEEKGIAPINYNPITRSIIRGRLAISDEN